MVEQSARALLIAYGNLSREDDGVAFRVVEGLRSRLGLETPLLDGDYEDFNGRLAMISLHQLAPELSETVADYDIVVFIDAHVDGAGWPVVYWQEVDPVYRSTMVIHHLSPNAVVALAKSLYGRAPRAYTLSVLGTSFDFGMELSETTRAYAEQAVDLLEGFLNENDIL